MKKDDIKHGYVLIIPVLITVCLLVYVVKYERLPFTSSTGIEELDEVNLEETLNLISKSIAQKDAKTFSDLCEYPIVRPYPLKDIEDAGQMQDYFDIIFDDSTCNLFKDVSADDWEEVGYRGYSLNRGQLWVSDKLYAINFLSEKEYGILQDRIAMDIESLHPALRFENMAPEICFKSAELNSIFRIDIDLQTDSMRLAAFTDGDLKGNASFVGKGIQDIGGSGGITSYDFTLPDGKVYSFTNGTNDGSWKLVVYPDGEGDGSAATETKISVCYWLDEVEKF